MIGNVTALGGGDAHTVVSYRSSYLDLVVNGEEVQGGCTAWSVFLDSGLTRAAYFYRPSSIQLMVASSVSTVATAIACNDTDKVDSLIDHLLSPPSLSPSSSSNFSSSSLICNDRKWSLGRCLNSVSNFYYSAVCIDCPDPCTSLQPGCGEGGVVGSSPYTISPCFNSQCPSPVISSSPLARVLSVVYEDFEVYPTHYIPYIHYTLYTLYVLYTIHYRWLLSS